MTIIAPPPAPVNQLAAFRDYQAGAAIFAAGGVPDADASVDCHRGWMTALAAAADADTYSYLDQTRPAAGNLQRSIDFGTELQEFIDGVEDDEWIRRGC